MIASCTDLCVTLTHLLLFGCLVTSVILLTNFAWFCIQMRTSRVR